MGQREQFLLMKAKSFVSQLNQDVASPFLRILEIVDKSSLYMAQKRKIYHLIHDMTFLLIFDKSQSYSKFCNVPGMSAISRSINLMTILDRIVAKPNETSSDYVQRIKELIPASNYNNEKTKVQMQTIEVEDDEQ